MDPELTRRLAEKNYIATFQYLRDYYCANTELASALVNQLLDS